MKNERAVILYPEQCRMARAAKGWTFEELAQHAGLAKNTVLAFETGYSVRDTTIYRIKEAFEKVGVRFEADANRVSVKIA